MKPIDARIAADDAQLNKHGNISPIDFSFRVDWMRFPQPMLTKRNSHTYRDYATPAFSPPMRATG